MEAQDWHPQLMKPPNMQQVISVNLTNNPSLDKRLNFGGTVVFQEELEIRNQVGWEGSS